MKYDIGDYIEFNFSKEVKMNGMISETYNSVQHVCNIYNLTLDKLKVMNYNFTKKQLTEPVYKVIAEKQAKVGYSYFVPEDTITKIIETVTVEKLY